MCFAMTAKLAYRPWVVNAVRVCRGISFVDLLVSKHVVRFLIQRRSHHAGEIFVFVHCSIVRGVLFNAPGQ
jgi:hypothetical protein